MTQPLLEITDVRKQYKSLCAVDGVSLSIDPGTCFGLLGPNGAGKTTLIEIVEDIIRPTSGTVRYKGHPRGSNFRQEVGIMFQQTALFSYMTVFETLKTFARLYDHCDDIDRLIRLCYLNEVGQQLNDRISGGQKQRLLLALALLNRPDLIFLDEPSTGLDPQARRNMWDIITTIKAQGRTIVLTTHYMEEAEKLCDDVAIMDKGQIIARGEPQALIKTHCPQATVTVPTSEFPEGGDGIEGFIRQHGERIVIRTQNVNGVVGQLLARGVDMRVVDVKTPNLEDVFLKLTGRSLRE
ncbi:ABC transporter ATP-binding protein [Desulfosarcina ovata]|uniref:ABC transporter ATP-binding protein n=1 Tax=Desulfosarcina ovata subsp. ovata TaxID=2752305 RepID=A0A5K8A5J5_9BACT|nr:ABC transporter ATP-binding protein [Desulfosarcina ovata]BBO87726.1 ABC transporter ATP-binding protein [Desulfosarcina ovata subsp. ovata]